MLPLLHIYPDGYTLYTYIYVNYITLCYVMCNSCITYETDFFKSTQAQLRTARASSLISRTQTAASFRQLTEKLKSPEWTCWCKEARVSGVLKWYRQAGSRPENADSPLTWLERYGGESVAIITKGIWLHPSLAFAFTGLSRAAQGCVSPRKLCL